MVIRIHLPILSRAQARYHAWRHGPAAAAGSPANWADARVVPTASRNGVPWRGAAVVSVLLAVGAWLVAQDLLAGALSAIALVAWIVARHGDQRRRRRRSEMARALRELPALRHQLRKAGAKGKAADALLLRAGYREGEVREWILRRARARGAAPPTAGRGAN